MALRRTLKIAAAVTCVRSWTFGTLVLGTAALGGCVGDVTMREPLTGATETCTESLHGFDPWSQKDSCVAKHIAEGWVRVTPAEPVVHGAG